MLGLLPNFAHTTSLCLPLLSLLHMASHGLQGTTLAQDVLKMLGKWFPFFRKFVDNLPARSKIVVWQEPDLTEEHQTRVNNEDLAVWNADFREYLDNLYEDDDDSICKPPLNLGPCPTPSGENGGSVRVDAFAEKTIAIPPFPCPSLADGAEAGIEEGIPCAVMGMEAPAPAVASSSSTSAWDRDTPRSSIPETPFSVSRGPPSIYAPGDTLRYLGAFTNRGPGGFVFE